ncbi:MAG: magnesium transporter, partial [Erysipelotrichaceae bacterium]|nr:magnesium transporter [Erysipelotrichaceae bacterium]
FKAAGYRFVWLLILAVVNIPLILITGLFEEVLASFAILVMFQPLILALSGNVATQTLAITLLFLNKEGGSARNLAKREIGAGVISGVVLSVVAGLAAALIAYIIKSPYIWQVGLMIGLSLFLCVAIAPFIGFIVPFTLNKLKIDPSAASGPLITSLVDLIAIIIYFGLATLILGGMI